ncbi:uncharacterized protein LOC142585069 isoform X2 [Dermacentor variabilis]
MTHCIFVVLLVGHAAGTFDYKGRATLADVKAFFSTNEKVAVLVRSYARLIEGEDVVCLYNEQYKWSTSTSLQLQQHYYFYNKSNIHRIHGQTHKAIVGRSYPVYMTLSKEPGLDVSPTLWATKAQGGNHDENGRMYYFDYYDPEGKCAVITFSDGP